MHAPRLAEKLDHSSPTELLMLELRIVPLWPKWSCQHRLLTNRMQHSAIVGAIHKLYAL